MSVAAVSSAHI